MSEGTERLSEWLFKKVEQNSRGQSGVADAIGVRVQYVNRWLKGTRPDRDNCYKIAIAYGVTPEFILELAGHDTAPRTEYSLDDPLVQAALVYGGKLSSQRKEVIRDLIKSMAEEGTERDGKNGLGGTSRSTQGTE